LFNDRPFKRSERVSDKIRIAISDVLLKNISICNKGLITVTNVVISKDLRYSKIFFTNIDTEIESSEIQKKLNQNKNKIRYHMGKLLDAQYVPNIRFEFDKQYAKTNKIENLLNRMNKKQ